MGGIHPRLKRPVGRRLAVAAASMMHATAAAAGAAGDGGGDVFASALPLTGPTIAGCSYGSSTANTAGGSPSPSPSQQAEELSLTLKFNETLLAGAKTPLFEPFIYINDHFTKTRLGTNMGES
jgi:hypothetical protein